MSMIHETTIAGRDCLLVLHEHNTQQAPRTTYHFEVSEVEAQTGVEELEPQQSAVRMSQRVSFLLSYDDAADLRDALRNRGARLIAMPLWPDMAPHADWTADKVHDAQQWVNWDPVTGDYSLNADDGHARSSGLIIGTLVSEPKWPALTDHDGEVTLEVIENAPWAARIAPQADADPMVAWDIDPDWSEGPEETSHSLVKTQQIGRGREAVFRGTEHAAKREFSASFTLDRSGVRRLLGFWLAKNGPRDLFTITPWWRPEVAIGGTPPTINARFLSETIAIDWDGQVVATTSLQFRQAAEVVGQPAAAKPARAFLYKFTWDGGSTLPFTDWEAEITHDGTTYAPVAIEHENFTETITPEADELVIVSDNFDGNPLRALALLELERKLTLEVRECDPSSPAGAVLRFSGEVRKARAKGQTIRATASTLGGAFKRNIPSAYEQTSCNATWGDEICGVSTAAHVQTGTVAAVNGQYIDVTTAAGQADNYFANGWITIGTGDTAERRAIVNSDNIGGGKQRLLLHRPLRVHGIGAAVTFYPGCDGQQSTCIAKYSNGSRLFGFPRKPLFIDTVATGFKMKMGK